MPEVSEMKDLGPMSGVCACFTQNTLNGRPYDRIYRDILDGKNQRYNMMMERGGIFCELGHPAQVSADFERTETDLSNACAIITKIEELPGGKVRASGRILDTPAGRIYKALEPFYKFGFSSRGSYEVGDDTEVEGPDGWNQDTYVFKGFDIVALPANPESQISATESVKSKRKTKSARESLDLNAIADATEIAPEEISKELDKIFDDNGDIIGSELVTMRGYVEEENMEPKQEEVEVTEKTPEAEVKVEVQETESPMDSIKLDLQKALSEAAKLRQDLETADFNLSNERAESERLRLENDELRARLEAAERSVRDYEEIKSLSEKLVDSYHGAVDAADSEMEVVVQERDAIAVERDEANKRAEEWNRKAEEQKKATEAAKEEARVAQESLAKEQSRVSAYRKELSVAKEQIIDLSCQMYGVDKKAALEAVGKSPSSKIRSAVEGLVKNKIRLAGFESEIIPTGVQKTQPRSQIDGLVAQDEYDAELIKALQDYS